MLEIQVLDIYISCFEHYITIIINIIYWKYHWQLYLWHNSASRRYIWVRIPCMDECYIHIQAMVRLLLKKPGLDMNNLKNYRPVSNLPFVSEIIEKVVASRIEDHWTNINFMITDNQHIALFTLLRLHCLAYMMTL